MIVEKVSVATFLCCNGTPRIPIKVTAKSPAFVRSSNFTASLRKFCSALTENQKYPSLYFHSLPNTKYQIQSRLIVDE
jgi:hypothetical protein